MKVTIELDDTDEYETFTHAVGYKIVLDQVKEEIRQELKYAALGTEAFDVVDKLREFVYNSCQDEHLPND